MPVSFDLREVRRLEQRLQRVGRGQAEREMERALTDGGRATRTEASRAIRERYAVKLKWLNSPPRTGGRGKRLADPRYDYNALAFTIIGRGGGVNLIDFLSGNVQRYLKGRPPKKGVAVRVLKGKKSYIRNAFVRKPTRGGNKGQPLVFRRASGAGRYPLRQLYGPNVAQMLDDEKIQRRLFDFAEDRITKRLDRRLTRLIERAR